jgi:hypothetical protein
MKNNPFFAEIMTASLSEWTGQCWSWNQPPEFGSLLVTSHDNLQIFGIVHTIWTGSSDPVRIPTTYQKTHEELLRDQPQIFEFLQTTFTCVTVGYLEQNSMFYHLPEKPAKIHSFVAACTKDQYQQFFTSDQFLHLLFNLKSPAINVDELLLAILKQLQNRQVFESAKFHDFMQTFSMLANNDYQRLRIFLNRSSQLLR